MKHSKYIITAEDVAEATNQSAEKVACQWHNLFGEPEQMD